MATIGIHYVRAALEGAVRAGMDRQQLLQAADIAPEILDSPQARVTDEQLSQLIQTICTQIDDEFMGFSRHPCRYGNFALMVDLVRHSHSLQSLLKQACRFYTLTTDAFHMHLGQEGEQAFLQLDYHDQALDPEHFYLEFWLVIWHRFSSWFIAQHIPLQKIELTYTPDHYRDEFNLLFHCQANFDRPHNRLYFHKKWLATGLQRSDKEIQQFLNHAPMDLLSIPNMDSSFSHRVYRELNRQSFEHWPTFEVMAHTLHSSPQTLRRRLREENETYQAIKDQLRRDKAIELLSRDPMPIEEIGHRLGFSESRSFSRAFQKWTGLAPSVYRQQRNSDG